MTTCHFTLEENKEILDERAKHPWDFTPCDIPLVWVCSHCGAKFPPLANWKPTRCPKCHTEVVD